MRKTQMEKKNITPNPQQPVDRVPTGQLPSALAELSEESLGSQALSSSHPEQRCSYEHTCICPCACSYDGDEE